MAGLGPQPGGNSSKLNVAASTVIKAAPGTCVLVTVITAGSAPGTMNDVLTTGAAAIANQFGTIPNTVGTYSFNWPCKVGIVYIVGSGQVVAVSYA
jgi:hypothetical protein